MNGRDEEKPYRWATTDEVYGVQFDLETDGHPCDAVGAYETLLYARQWDMMAEAERAAVEDGVDLGVRWRVSTRQAEPETSGGERLRRRMSKGLGRSAWRVRLDD